MTDWIRKPWFWLALCVAAVGAALLISKAIRPRPADDVPPSDAAVESRVQEPPPSPAELPIPTTHPAAREWLSVGTYLDTGGRMISRYDADGDGILDADELLMYGTLRYDAKTRLDAPRIDIKPSGSTAFVSSRNSEGERFREMANRSLRPDEDTDNNGLPDEWERRYFGRTGVDPYGNPTGDGFPNIIKWYRGSDPTKPELLDLSMKPAELEDSPAPQTPWDIRWDMHSRRFWEAQERTAARLLGQASRP